MDRMRVDSASAWSGRERHGVPVAKIQGAVRPTSVVVGCVRGQHRGYCSPKISTDRCIQNARCVPCGCRLLRPCRSCRMAVLMEDAAESVSPEDVKLVELAWFGERLGYRP